MANNPFGIEDDFSQAEVVNDALFSDTNPDDLEDVKKKEAEEAAKKAKEEEEKKKEAEVKAKNPKPVVAKVVPPEEADPNHSLFGEDAAEEEDKEDDKEKEDLEEEDKKDDDSLTQFEILSKELYNLGVFSAEVDEESGEPIQRLAKTPQEFKQLFEYQQETGMYSMLENHLSRFGQDRLELFDAVFNKGVDLKEYMPVYKEVEDLGAISLDNEVNQEKIVREYYKRAGMAEDKVNTKIQRLKDNAELLEEAETFRDSLIEQDKKILKQQQDTKEAEAKSKEAQEAQYKGSLLKILTEKIKAKDFDGIPVTEQVARKTFDFLYNKKWQDGQGKKFTDFDKFILELNKPENHALKVKVGLLAQEQFDLSKVQKRAVSKESSELFKDLTTKKIKKEAKSKSDATSWNSIV